MSNAFFYIKNNQNNELFDFLLDSQINSDPSLLHGFYHAAYEAKNFKAMEIIFDHLKKFPESKFMESVLNGVVYALLVNRDNKYESFSKQAFNHFFSIVYPLTNNSRDKNRTSSCILGNALYFRKDKLHEILNINEVKLLLSDLNFYQRDKDILYEIFYLADQNILFLNNKDNQNLKEFIINDLEQHNMFSPLIFKQLLINKDYNSLYTYLTKQNPTNNPEVSKMEMILLTGISYIYLKEKENKIIADNLLEFLMENNFLDIDYSFNSEQLKDSINNYDYNYMYSKNNNLTLLYFSETKQFCLKIKNDIVYETNNLYENNSTCQIGQYLENIKEQKPLSYQKQQEMNDKFKNEIMIELENNILKKQLINNNFKSSLKRL